MKRARFAMAIVVFCALGIGAQQVASRPTAAGQSAATAFTLLHLLPSPSDLVTIDTQNVSGADSAGVTIAPVSHVVLYQVPIDRWLVLTRIQATGPFAAYLNIDLVEDFGGTLTSKSNGYCFPGTAEFQYPMGVAFQPGSSVALRNRNTSASLWVPANMTGYLVAH